MPGPSTVGVAEARPAVFLASSRSRLSDAELGGVRGARAVAFSGGPEGLRRVTDTVTVRDAALARDVMVQQFDNWLFDVGQPLIAANLLN